ncbi:sulfur carrier protein ThiS [Roseateles amylovorans]|uniref:Sulfur carrier protein ThiS n=1 Tax=Roseateles amylovorans TaxID=2978473 RepID=A0ABY6B3K2_9BURK|nr:sulfur carrier protein ThiS [Roseateles amylovorans]UXH77855.1 sulfur carrier protein ThiS [Roseateles amylovorans]
MDSDPTPTSITVRLDDRDIVLRAGSSLSDLLTHAQRAPDSVATAVNGRFVARDRRAATRLQEGDQVLFFQPIVGG